MIHSKATEAGQDSYIVKLLEATYAEASTLLSGRNVARRCELLEGAVQSAVADIIGQMEVSEPDCPVTA